MIPIVIRIIYDNREEDPSMQAGWGFSCLVEIGHRKILFDTGADTKAFLANLQQLKISSSEITDVLFSHKHSDHVTGLQEILGNMKRETRLFLPRGFPMRSLSVQTTYVSDIAEIDTDIYSLVMRGGWCLYEQALILRTNRGLVVITGCAHPGIIHLLKAIKKRLGEPLHLVLGGFHLFKKSPKSINKIVTQLKSLGVEKIAPCHCSGEIALTECQKAYQENYYRIGTGSVLTLVPNQESL